MSSLDFTCEYVLLNQISGENLQRGQKSRHRLEELLQKADSTARDRHSPEVGEEEKHVTAQNCIFFRRDTLGREDDWKMKMQWYFCLKMPRPGQRQQAQQQDQRLRWYWENKITTIQAQLQANNRNYQQLPIADNDLLLLCSPFVTLNFKLWKYEKDYLENVRMWKRLMKGLSKVA